MKTHDLIRAWKDRSYRENLTEEERRDAASPVGVVELADEQLTNIVGASGITGAWGGTNVNGKTNCLYEL